MKLAELVAFRIRKARRERDLTQAQAAALIGVSQNAWATYETGRRGVSLELLDKIARAFSKPVEYFVSVEYEEIVKAPLPKVGSRRQAKR